MAVTNTSENELWGLYAEGTARFSYSLEQERATFYDARDDRGEPVEIKACKRRTGDRGDFGKYFIREENHRELLDADGWYVFVIYDPQNWKEGPVLAMKMVAAAWLENVERYQWTFNGSRRGETVIRPPWTAVFNRTEIPGENQG